MQMLVFDLEFCQPGDAIIEVGAAHLDLREDAISKAFESFADPGELPCEEVMHLTGISHRQIIEATDVGRVLDDFWQVLDQSSHRRLGAWGPRDFECLFDQSAHPPERWSVEMYDLQQLVRFLLFTKGESFQSGLSLDSAAESCGISFEERHRAFPDAEVAAGVLQHHANLLKKIFESDDQCGMMGEAIDESDLEGDL